MKNLLSSYCFTNLPDCPSKYHALSFFKFFSQILSIFISQYSRKLFVSILVIFWFVYISNFSDFCLIMEMTIFDWLSIILTVVTVPLYVSIIIITIKDWKYKKNTVNLLFISQVSEKSSLQK